MSYADETKIGYKDVISNTVAHFRQSVLLKQDIQPRKLV